MTEPAFDLDSYFDRIGYAGPRAATPAHVPTGHSVRRCRLSVHARDASSTLSIGAGLGCLRRLARFGLRSQPKRTQRRRCNHIRRPRRPCRISLSCG
jgi:hypothetical protein